MHVHWLTPCAIDHAQEVLDANMASLRLRAGPAILAGRNAGIHFTFGDTVQCSPDVCVIGKIGLNNYAVRSQLWVETIQKLRANSVRLILDYTDDHIGANTEFAKFYRTALALVDEYVVSSRTLYRTLVTLGCQTVHYIPDANEYPIVDPSKKSNPVPRLLWFGHGTNVSYLVDFLSTVDDGLKFELWAITDDFGQQHLAANTNRFPGSAALRWFDWSIDIIAQAGPHVDGVLLPTGAKDPRKAGASANRLITALSLGLPVISGNLDAYQPYASYFQLLGASPFDSAINDLENWHDRVRKAQSLVVPQFAFDTIGAQWCQMLRKGSTDRSI